MFHQAVFIYNYYISQRGEGPCSMLVLRGERRYSAGPDHKPPAKSHKLFWTVTGATLLTGATVVYAKKNPDFREWLVANAPWADNLVTIVYQENNGIGQWATTQWNGVSKYISEFMFGKPGNIPEKRLTGKDSDLTAKGSFGPQDYNLPKPALAPRYVEEKRVETPVCPPAKVIKTEPAHSEPPPKVPVTKDIVDMEKNLHESTKTAVDNYNKATEACGLYNKALDKIVEATVEDLDRKKFDHLKNAQSQRVTAVMLAEEAAKKAEQLMDELGKLLEAGGAAPADASTSARRHLAKFRADLNSAREQFREEGEKACIGDKYWQKVEAARTAYIDELQVLFPGVDVAARRLNSAGGDPDLLLLHTLRQVLYLQQELAEIQTVGEQRLQRAIQSRDDKELINAKVRELVYKEKWTMDREYQKKCLEIRAESQQRLRNEMKRQLELHQEHLQDRLAAKEKEVLKRFETSISENVEKERVVFHRQLGEMRGKLSGIEDSVKARAQADAMARRSQSLWAAGESLLAATRKPSETTTVHREIQAVEKAGGDDELVKTVVKGIPQDVRDKGLLTENALREKYIKMERTALRVALVSKDGAPLPIYLLSWIQSLVLFSRISAIPKNELDNQPTDYTRMDAYDILQRARYWIERNDIAAALRYVNLLEGASRTAAASWREAAIRHLEIKQAAEAVMAHAAAAGLLYL